MIGAHDDRLKWPLDVIVAFRLLNQLDQTCSFDFIVDMRNVRRITETTGKHVKTACQFFTYDKLEYNENLRTQYLKNHTISFIAKYGRYVRVL